MLLVNRYTRDDDDDEAGLRVDACSRPAQGGSACPFGKRMMARRAPCRGRMKNAADEGTEGRSRGRLWSSCRHETPWHKQETLAGCWAELNVGRAKPSERRFDLKGQVYVCIF